MTVELLHADCLEGVPCVLVEREAEYVEIIRHRLAETAP